MAMVHMTSEPTLVDRGPSALAGESARHPCRSDRPHAAPRLAHRASRVALGVLIATTALALAFPLLWMTASAFKTTAAIVGEAYPLSWRTFVPARPTLGNFSQLFGVLGFGRNMVNTFIAAAGQVLGAMVVCTLAGYGFARTSARWAGLVFGLCMLGAFVPVEAVVVPLYQTVTALGLRSTYVALFAPFVCNPLGIFLMRQSFRDIPGELFDAASLDGAGGWRTFRHVALPEARPALATLCLVQFIWSWSNYFWPLIVNQDPGKVVAQVALASLRTSANYHPLYGEMFAAATVITAPVVVLSTLLQRYYVRGLLTSGIT